MAALGAASPGLAQRMAADVGVDIMRLDREATATAEVIDAIRTGRRAARDAGRAAAG
jgi:hypothetical protein